MRHSRTSPLARLAPLETLAMAAEDAAIGVRAEALLDSARGGETPQASTRL